MVAARALAKTLATLRFFSLVVPCLIAAGALAASARAESRQFSLTAGRTQVSIGGGLSYLAWTYDGAVPGPILRVRQGDQVSIRLANHTSEAHGIEIFGAQISPDHFNAVPPAAVSYTFHAAVPGVFDYHCSAIPVLDHVASGMYGMMIVEPRDGWPNGRAQQVDLVQGEFYGTTDASGMVKPNHERMLAAEPDFVVFNGQISRYGASNPIAIKVGKLVRVFFLNAGPNLSSTFHVTGVLFSTVYVDGNPANALHDLPNLQVAPGEGAVFEFKVEEPGDYRFVDNAGAHSYKGALGIFRATR